MDKYNKEVNRMIRERTVGNRDGFGSCLPGKANRWSVLRFRVQTLGQRPRPSKALPDLPDGAVPDC